MSLATVLISARSSASASRAAVSEASACLSRIRAASCMSEDRTASDWVSPCASIWRRARRASSSRRTEIARAISQSYYESRYTRPAPRRSKLWSGQKGGVWLCDASKPAT